MHLMFLGLAILAVTSSIHGRLTNEIVNNSNLMDLTTLPTHMVSLWTKENHRYSHFCSGFLLEDNLILTTAHCLRGRNYSSIRVQAGCTNEYLLEKFRTIDDWHIHPGYEEEFTVGGMEISPLKHDIAIIWMKTPMKLDNETKIVDLYKKSLNLGITGEIYEWGIGTGNFQNTCMHKVSLRISKCDRLDIRYRFCVKELATRNFTTSGNNGSPFIINGTAAGILSKPLRKFNDQMEFTDLSYYSAYIQEARAEARKKEYDLH